MSVKSDPLRTYLITVSYTGKDPALAVAITNAFVAEFLRSSKLQTLSQQRSSAEATLSRQLAKFGDKHPRVTQAKMRLAATDDLLKKQLSEAPEVLLQAAGENVTKAIAAHFKSQSMVCDRSPSTRWSRGRYRSCSLARAKQVGGSIFSLC